MYDDNLSLVPASLLDLATETAAELGRAWTVKAILSSAILVHPIGHRIMLHEMSGHAQLTARMTVSADPSTPLEEVTARVPLAGRTAAARRVADAIRSRILPRLGSMDAIAGLRVLWLPLREAGIDALAHGHTERAILDYRRAEFGPSGADLPPADRRPLQVIIRSLRRGHTRAEINIPYLALPDAVRLAASVLPRVYTPVPVADHLPAEVHKLAVQLPGMTAAHVVSDVPRLTDLTDPSGHLVVRHFLSVKDTGTRSWAAIGLHDAPIATAYVLLSAYAAR